MDKPEVKRIKGEVEESQLILTALIFAVEEATRADKLPLGPARELVLRTVDIAKLLSSGEQYRGTVSEETYKLIKRVAGATRPISEETIYGPDKLQ